MYRANTCLVLVIGSLAAVSMHCRIKLSVLCKGVGGRSTIILLVKQSILINFQHGMDINSHPVGGRYSTEQKKWNDHFPVY